MNLLPKCSRCGSSVAPFTSVCDQCVVEEKDCETNVRKLKEEAFENQRIAKVDKIASQLSNPLAILLVQEIDRWIKLNHSKPDESERAILRDVTDVYFTAEISTGVRMHVPYTQILHVVEAPGAPLLISAMHLVVYKGSLGVSVPIG